MDAAMYGQSGEWMEGVIEWWMDEGREGGSDGQMDGGTGEGGRSDGWME